MKFSTTVLCFALVIFLAVAVRGDVVFSVAKTTPGPIGKGDSATFEVAARTVSGVQSFSFVGFNVKLSRADGAGGVFSTFSNYIGGLGWVIEEGKTTALYDGASGNGIASFNPSNTVIGSITLVTDAVVVDEGEYTIELLKTDVVDTTSGYQVIPSTAAGPLAYSITSVPEPSTVILLSAISLGVAGGRFRRWFSRSR